MNWKVDQQNYPDWNKEKGKELNKERGKEREKERKGERKGKRGQGIQELCDNIQSLTHKKLRVLEWGERTKQEKHLKMQWLKLMKDKTLQDLRCSENSKDKKNKIKRKNLDTS